jgi:hypothetical protein
MRWLDELCALASAGDAPRRAQPNRTEEANMTTIMERSYEEIAASRAYIAIPRKILRSLCEWGELRRPYPFGNFVMALLTNNLSRAFLHADDENRAALRQYVGFLHNEMPSPAWGSPEKVAAWLAMARAQAEATPTLLGLPVVEVEPGVLTDPGEIKFGPLLL